MTAIDLLNKSDSAKFKETHKSDPAITFDSEDDYTITRRRHTRRPPRIFTLGFTGLSDADKTTLEAFWQAQGGGSDLINGWLHPVTGEAIPVRFRPGVVPDFQYRGRGTTALWDASNVTLEEI